MEEVAFLVYNQDHKNTRRERDFFDGRSNIGAYMVKDILERKGCGINFCSPESAKNFKIVLVSLPSPFDVYNMIKATAPLTAWKNRQFKVIVGGAGIQNPIPLRHCSDYALFGRAEGIIDPLVSKALKGESFSHPSVMDLRKPPIPVTFAQTTELYPHELNVLPHKFREQHIGCPKKCFFCHYSFSRRLLTPETSDKSFHGIVGYSGQDEVVFRDLPKTWNGKARLRTGIDGFSERLRYAFNKRISNEEILSVLAKLSEMATGTGVYLNIYMVGAYPTETNEDIEEFTKLCSAIKSYGKRIYISLHITSLRPAPLTPAAWLPANITANWRQRFKIEKQRVVADNAHAYVFFKWHFFEHPLALLLNLISIRATNESDSIINTILFSRKFNSLNSDMKLKALRNTFDLSPYTKEYNIEKDQLPTWYLNSYIPHRKIKTYASRLKANLECHK